MTICSIFDIEINYKKFSKVIEYVNIFNFITYENLRSIRSIYNTLLGNGLLNFLFDSEVVDNTFTDDIQEFYFSAIIGN